MRIILFATIFTLLLLKATADNNYIQYARYPNTNGKNKIAFSDDELSVLLYSSDDSNIYFFRSYDMKPTFNADCQGKTQYLQTFTNSQQGSAIIIASEDGQILLRNFTSKDSQVQVKLNNLENCNLLKVSPSPDKQNFAALCEDSTQLIIGNLLKMGDALDSVEMGFTVSAFQWHPAENKIAVAGTNKDDNSFHLVIYDAVNKQKTEDFSKYVKDNVKDLEYSNAGQKLAFIQQGATDPQMITIINLATKPQEITWLNAPEATQLIELRRSGKLLTAYDAQKSYAWVFDGGSYGNYNSILRSTGLSRTGGSLFTLDPLSKEVVLSKICKPNQIFLNEDLTCAVCQPPCNTCFVKQTQCSSCVDTFYLDEDFYVCKGCIENCKTCDAQKCKICLDGYYLDDANKCNSCASLFVGCATCSSQGCNKCDEANNWILNANNQCQCKAKFIKIGDKCVGCPNHCSVCKTADTCEVCDTTEHRKPTPVEGKCLCDSGYFQDITDVCQTCVVGCSICDNKATCTTCDTANHWVLDKQSLVCACQSSYLQIQNQCTSCSKLMEGCSICTSEHICTICTEGYDLDTNTNHCVKHPQDGISTLVVIIIAFVVLIAIAAAGYLIVRIIRKKRGKKVQTLLESEAENEHEELS